jgi:hypothetical protein
MTLNPSGFAVIPTALPTHMNYYRSDILPPAPILLKMPFNLADPGQQSLQPLVDFIKDPHFEPQRPSEQLDSTTTIKQEGNVKTKVLYNGRKKAPPKGSSVVREAGIIKRKSVRASTRSSGAI